MYFKAKNLFQIHHHPHELTFEISACMIKAFRYCKHAFEYSENDPKLVNFKRESPFAFVVKG